MILLVYAHYAHSCQVQGGNICKLAVGEGKQIEKRNLRKFSFGA